MDRGWLAHGLIACPISGHFVQKLACYELSSRMSAFPESGRSDRQKLGEIRVRFRPEAASASICYVSISHGYYKIRYKLIIVVIRITLRITQHAGVAERIVPSNVKMLVYPNTGIGILNQIVKIRHTGSTQQVVLMTLR